MAFDYILPTRMQVSRALRDTCLLHHAAALEASCPGSCGAAMVRNAQGQLVPAAAGGMGGAIGELYGGLGVFGPAGRSTAASSAATVQQTAGAHRLQNPMLEPYVYYFALIWCLLACEILNITLNV